MLLLVKCGWFWIFSIFLTTPRGNLVVRISVHTFWFDTRCKNHHRKWYLKKISDKSQHNVICQRRRQINHWPFRTITAELNILYLHRIIHISYLIIAQQPVHLSNTTYTYIRFYILLCTLTFISLSYLFNGISLQISLMLKKRMFIWNDCLRGSGSQLSHRSRGLDSQRRYK